MITIPKQFYVGSRVQEDKNNPIPLAFLTPVSTDKAFEKRKATVDSWADPYKYYSQDDERRKPKLDPFVIDNAPVDGYKVAEEIRRYGWGKGNVVWRMVDPRGFEFEISSPNLASILDCSTIKNGVIEGACVFGRNGAQNVLLPISSQPYRTATNNTTRAGKRIPLKEVKVGDVIVLKDGRTGIYLGSKNVIQRDLKQDRHSYGHGYATFYHTTLNLAEFKQRYLVCFIASKNENAKNSWNEYPWSSRLGRKLTEGEQYVEGYSDLHVSEIVKDSDLKLDPNTCLLPENMYGAYAVIGPKVKPAEVHIILQPYRLAEFLKISCRRSYTSATAFITQDGPAPYFLRVDRPSAYGDEKSPVNLFISKTPFSQLKDLSEHLKKDPILKYSESSSSYIEPTQQLEDHTIWVAVMVHEGIEIVINA